jgi:hypothetical protein
MEIFSPYQLPRKQLGVLQVNGHFLNIKVIRQISSAAAALRKLARPFLPESFPKREC